MKSTMKMDMLEEIKALHNQPELSENDMERWDELCNALYSGDFRELLLSTMDDDQELTSQLAEFMNTSGISIQEIAYGGVAIGNYLLEKLYPTDCGYDHFGEFWVESCCVRSEIMCSIDNAINRAFDKLLDDEMHSNNEAEK